MIGEDKYSYGFGSSGKAATTSNFFSYGKEYGLGDTIGCYLVNNWISFLLIKKKNYCNVLLINVGTILIQDLESEPSTVGFTKNGEDLGSAFQLAVDLSGKALFPHIYIKNARVQINFGTNVRMSTVTVKTL